MQLMALFLGDLLLKNPSNKINFRYHILDHAMIIRVSIDYLRPNFSLLQKDIFIRSDHSSQLSSLSDVALKTAIIYLCGISIQYCYKFLVNFKTNLFIANLILLINTQTVFSSIFGSEISRQKRLKNMTKASLKY